ncbi:cation:proton antiporter [Sphingosinicella microcystinivorans]|uniref:Na(+)/H(+) antiporter NhaP n=1 Tax=Sphingosinicella microcystinivorans TaxID=335406 RepID=A0AAD1D423_SPHMI|nr:sodium:proton antiporter [Sphingosinicella microcystinivorans]RKS85007.1 sodium/proton antiporter (CPA1 family) [Sphingosinicella microcystinivorans]BBE33335.1 Na(+)/H(+) antiporter NhaP [Sphingosinicella microcystinivorans]
MIGGLALTPFNAAAVLIVTAAVLGYINFRFLRLPSSIGLTVMGAIASVLVVALDELLPASSVSREFTAFISGIDFHSTLMDGMLSFLLFGGALHVSWKQLHQGRWAILLLSTVGVVLSTIIVGTGFLWLTRAMGYSLPGIWCFVFGALISPTDPVSVMSVLKRTSVSPLLEATVAGESLFNDGVGVVIFAILLATATSGAPLDAGHAALLFLEEAGGGILLGLVIGWIAFRAMRSIDDYKVEVMISLATVMGGYAIANPLHVSGPVAMAVAGLIIGNAGVAHAMSDKTWDYLNKFWDLIDDILNTVLFLLIGLEVVTVPRDPGLILLGVGAIALSLLARSVSVMLPLSAFGKARAAGKVVPVTLIWGGLRGGISVALALGLPPGDERNLILAATYAVVLFTVVVQGGTIAKVLQRLDTSKN